MGERTNGTPRPNVRPRPGTDRRPVAPPAVHPRPTVHPHPTVRVDVRWPWQHRHRRGWSPTYRYRQVVYADVGWGHRKRESRLDIRTYYRHRVRSATRSRAEMEIYIDRIEIFENGYFLGEVRNIPRELSRVNATMYRRGTPRFDRDLFIIGGPDVGFELISTRHYGGFVLNHYRRSHGFRVGALDFQRRRVRTVSYSRFFDPYDFRGFVPIHLLPEDEAWLGDYGYGSPSHSWYGDDDVWYYGYGANDGVRTNHGSAGYNEVQPRSATSGRASSLPQAQPLQRTDEKTFRTDSGAEIRLRRDVTLERVE